MAQHNRSNPQRATSSERERRERAGGIGGTGAQRPDKRQNERKPDSESGPGNKGASGGSTEQDIARRAGTDAKPSR